MGICFLDQMNKKYTLIQQRKHSIVVMMFLVYWKCIESGKVMGFQAIIVNKIISNTEH